MGEFEFVPACRLQYGDRLPIGQGYACTVTSPPVTGIITGLEMTQVSTDRGMFTVAPFTVVAVVK